MALSESFTDGADDARSQSANRKNPSGRRKQLYILYLLNDLLHHTKYHIDSSSAHSTLASQMQSHLNDLFGSASTHRIEVYAMQHKKIQDILDLWDSNGYYQSSYIGKLRETATNAARLGHQSTDDASMAAKAAELETLAEEKRDAPYIMPSSHGESSTPFYDLPAANMLPHIMPNSTTPINPQLVKPLQFVAGPAEESLTNAVKDFLRDIDSLDGVGLEDEGQTTDIDELGQWVMRDEITGDILGGDGYYGWSRVFCGRMRRRGTGLGDDPRSMERNSAVNRDLSPRKRRYSDSDSSRRSRSMSRSRSDSVRSRQDRHRNGQASVPRSRSRSRSPSRETRPYRRFRSRTRSMSRSCSYSPPPVMPAKQETPQSADPRRFPRDRAQGPSPPQLLPFAHPFSQGFPPLGPSGLPVPPPPPNYKGPWPPPPPPISISNDGGYPHAVPPIPPPTGPRMYQNNGPSLFPQGTHTNTQGQVLQDPIGWNQQQQLGPSSSLSYGGHGRGKPPLSDSIPNGRGRGFGPRGWVR